MKKIVVMILALLLTLSVVSCGLFAEETTTTTTTATTTTNYREETKQLLLDLTLKFPIQYEDTAWEGMEEQTVYGTADLLMGAPNESVDAIIYQGQVCVFLELYLSESARTEVLVWDVMITYIDYDRHIYIELDYYHYDEFLIADYADEKVEMKFGDFITRIDELTLEDYEWLLLELGYYEVSEEQ